MLAFLAPFKSAGVCRLVMAGNRHAPQKHRYIWAFLDENTGKVTEAFITVTTIVMCYHY